MRTADVQTIFLSQLFNGSIIYVIGATITTITMDTIYATAGATTTTSAINTIANDIGADISQPGVIPIEIIITIFNNNTNNTNKNFNGK